MLVREHLVKLLAYGFGKAISCIRLSIFLLQAATAGEVPIGAVVVHNGEVVCSCWNTMESSQDPTKHAEMSAIQQAALRVGRFKLPECTLYVTLEPCPMCAGAILQARIGTLVYAAKNPLLGKLAGMQELAYVILRREAELLQAPTTCHVMT